MFFQMFTHLQQVTLMTFNHSEPSFDVLHV